jgi:hypothetical protein
MEIILLRIASACVRCRAMVLRPKRPGPNATAVVGRGLNGSPDLITKSNPHLATPPPYLPLLPIFVICPYCIVHSILIRNAYVSKYYVMFHALYLRYIA